MRTELHKTSTGEFTLYRPDLDETYHSRHGAISESQHVFIDQGLKRIKKQGEISVFELGLGTGLNALLSMIYAIDNRIMIKYHSIEPFPISMETIHQLNYGQLVDSENAVDHNKKIHSCSWEEWIELNEHFSILKQKMRMQEVTLEDESIDLIYFDAFGAQKQEELWQLDIFQKLYNALNYCGILTTYAAAGQLKRNLRACGFRLEHPQGANGKREMTVAIKD